MSIVPLRHVTLLGVVSDKTAVVARLQDLGFLQLRPLRPEDALPREVGGGPSPQARDALAFLLGSPWQRRHKTRTASFDAQELQAKALALKERLRVLEDERDFLTVRIRDLEPWGAFEFGSVEEMGGQRLWFYQVPLYQLSKVPPHLPVEIIRRDHRFAYLVVVTPDEPTDMPLPRVHTGAISRAKLIERLEEVEAELEDIQAERGALTRWSDLFARSLSRLEDEAARDGAETLTVDEDPLFALAAWVPAAREDELRQAMAEHDVALVVRDPGPDDAPPTLFSPSPRLAGAQSLVTFYMTPGYFTWDPSVVVLLAFSVMFAMIVADAGYGLVLAAIGALSWRRTSTGMRLVVGSVVGATIVYGVLVGSYFGVVASGGMLGALRVLDAADPPTMMAVSVVLGVLHLAFANAADAWRLRSSASIAPLGWIAILLGGLWAIGSVTGMVPESTRAGLVVVGIGALGVLLFSATGVGFGTRLIRGLLALTGVTNAFGDVLSYLRLFALGLASGSLAAAFNDLAMQSKDALKGGGLAIALVVLVVGHGLNFLLALMSGAVHGLRLNYIEFFNWGLKEEGKPFRAFRRKEIESWKPSS